MKLISEERIGVSFRRMNMRQKMKCIKKKLSLTKMESIIKRDYVKLTGEKDFDIL